MGIWLSKEFLELQSQRYCRLKRLEYQGAYDFGVRTSVGIVEWEEIFKYMVA